MKSFLRTLLLSGVPFGIFWGLYFGSGNGVSAAVWSGVIAGLIAGFAVAIIATIRQNIVSSDVPVATDEVLIRKGRATHEGVFGWLYLTDRRLLFQGYATDEEAPDITTLFERAGTDDRAYDVSIPVLRIAQVKPLGVVSRLDVTTTDGRKMAFGIEDLPDWVDDVDTARQKYLDEPRSESKKLFP